MYYLCFIWFQPGEYIKIYIAGVQKEIFKTFATGEQSLIVVGLLEFEHRMSLLNVVLKHSNNVTQPIKSKEKLVFQCGFRRFTASPIFSQHVNGTKYKVNLLQFYFLNIFLRNFMLYYYIKHFFLVWEIFSSWEYRRGEYVCTNHFLTMSNSLLRWKKGW